MSKEIPTLIFYSLVLVTMVLQLIMWYKRNKFFRTTRTTTDSKIANLGTLLEIVIPVRLTRTPDKTFAPLRKSAVTASNYWIVSLLLTLIVPIILFILTELV